MKSIFVPEEPCFITYKRLLYKRSVLYYSSSVNPTAAAAMDAIKKKMQAMKLEKDNAMDRADACEQQAKDANLRAERGSR